MKLIFLDIDGVCNSHKRMLETGICGIEREPIQQLNRIIRATDAGIVVSSAWRYVCSGRRPWMTLQGFGYMLHTHGFCGVNRLIGQTERDEVCPECGYSHKTIRGKVECDFGADNNRICVKCGTSSTRGRQINAWLRDNGSGLEAYVVLDDDAFDFKALGHPFVQTNPARGLTAHAATKAIRILNA